MCDGVFDAVGHLPLLCAFHILMLVEEKVFCFAALNMRLPRRFFFAFFRSGKRYFRY